MGAAATSSTYVLAAVRALNRLELFGETLRAALNAVATVAPDWLRAVAPTEWHERYDRRVEVMRLPSSEAKREACALQVGADGFRLLDALDEAGTPADLRELPAVAVLRRVWARHFERPEPGSGDAGGDGAKGVVRLHPARGGDPEERIESPYDPEARFRLKRGKFWTGYMVHLTETCDAEAPRLIVHAEATPATVHEAMRIEAIHDALAAGDLTPAEHLVDGAYVSGRHIVTARERHGIDLVGPPRPNPTWQGRTEGAFETADFAVDWENRRVRCPEGRTSVHWAERTNETSGGTYIRVRFSPADCGACASRSRCTRSKSRRIGLLPRSEHEAVAAAKARLETEAGRDLYAQRCGVEGTISQGVRAFGLRHARYRGLAKAGLQSVVTAAALDLDRLAAWFADRPIAPTRTSRFAALAA